MQVTYKTASGAQIELSLNGSKLTVKANGKEYGYRHLSKDGAVIECYDMVKITVPTDVAASVKEIADAHFAAIVEKHNDGYWGRADAVEQRIAACGGADSI